MAVEDAAIEGLDSFVNKLAESLGSSDPNSNRVLSKTFSDGSSEQYSPVSDTILSIRRAVEIKESLEMSKNGNQSMRFIKLTRN